MATVNKLDTKELEIKIKDVYRDVALNLREKLHFSIGRELAERLGYSPDDLDKIPSESVDSFAGTGYHFDLADIKEGESVLDMGSGSGMDCFMAALNSSDSGKVVGIDMTDEQLEKAGKLAAGFQSVSFRKGYIDKLPVEDESFDVVISNGVINLSPYKEKVFQEIGRALRHGGRMIISDLVSKKELPESSVCDSSIWASCIGGVIPEDNYKAAIEKAGLRVGKIRENPMPEFTSDATKNACEEFGVKSISLVAVK